MKTSKKVSIFNNKGGVAKTTSIINIAYCLQKKDKRVLVVDCDTQENCFTFFMSNNNENMILKTDYEKIDHTTWQRYCNVDEAERNEYDYILFDLPPMLSDEVKTIIEHSDKVYVPTILGEFEIAGLRRVTNAVGAKLGGIFVTMYQPDNDAEILKEFRNAMQDRFIGTIPYSKTIRESLKAGLPIEDYFIMRKVPNIPSAWKIVNAYTELTEKIMKGTE